MSVPDPGGSPGQALLALRLIGGSLGLGVTLFALIALFVDFQAATVPQGVDPELLLTGYIGLALLSALSALFLWRTRVLPRIRARDPDVDWAERASRIQSPLIVVWAVLDAVAMVGVGLHLLYGIGTAAAVGLALIWLGVAATWPRAGWFEPGRF